MFNMENELCNGFNLQDFSDPERAEALILELDLQADTDTIEENCSSCFSINSPPKDNNQEAKEYDVLTDDEAERRCKDYLDDNRDSWVEAVKANNTDLSWEDWKDEVMRNDGRGSILGSYDGCEESRTVNGTEYYIYRTN